MTERMSASNTERSISKARSFLNGAELPAPPKPRAIAKAGPTFAFDAAKEQASVVGSDVVAFVKGVTREQRQDIVNATLLAQLVAKKKVPNPQTLADVVSWYGDYFDVLEQIGFVVQDRGFAEYEEKSQSFEAHEAILDVATALLATTSPAALALVKTTLGALKKMSADSPWITLFNRESQSANVARFQVSLVERDADAQLLVSLIAFGLEAKSKLTQVLFFKFKKNEVTLNHHSGKVTINAPILEGIRDQIALKLVAFSRDFVEGLEL